MNKLTFEQLCSLMPAETMWGERVLAHNMLTPNIVRGILSNYNDKMEAIVEPDMNGLVADMLELFSNENASGISGEKLPMKVVTVLRIAAFQILMLTEQMSTIKAENEALKEKLKLASTLLEIEIEKNEQSGMAPVTTTGLMHDLNWIIGERNV